MSRLFLFSVVLPAVLSLTPSIRADEVRLADGRVVVGKVRTVGENLEISTRDGVVTVAKSEITGIRTDKELRAELKKLAKRQDDSAFAHLQLARTARSYGLTREMWGHLDRVLELADPEQDASVRRLSSKFLAKLEPELLSAAKRQGDTKSRVVAMLNKVRLSTPPSKRAAVIELLTHEPRADQVLRELSRRGLLPEQRVVAVSALLRRPVPGNDRFAYVATVLDDDREARRGAVQAIRELGDTGKAVRYLAPGFLSDSPTMRMRMAEAYTELGNAEEAVPLLVLAGPLAGTPRLANGGNTGVRAHMYALTQRAYIEDFDVEIAQAAAVANPIVGRVDDGVVLDVTVAAVITMRVPIIRSYRRALAALTGSDPGRNPATWRHWLEQRDPEAAAKLSGR